MRVSLLAIGATTDDSGNPGVRSRNISYPGKSRYRTLEGEQRVDATLYGLYGDYMETSPECIGVNSVATLGRPQRSELPHELLIETIEQNLMAFCDCALLIGARIRADAEYSAWG